MISHILPILRNKDYLEKNAKGEQDYVPTL